jgi:putative ABC transport system ATP-binding protein
VMPLVLERVSAQRGHGAHAVTVLRDVSLTVDAGEFVLLEGPSGAGKTTLMGVAAGLLRPSQGSVTLTGRRIERASAAERRRIRVGSVGFVFQQSNLLPNLSLRDNIALMAALAGASRRDAVTRARSLLEQLGLSGLSERRPREISGGEEQRVAVARALVHRPAMIFADEPTGSLDSASGRVVATLLSELARAQGSAVLVCTHDARLEPFATRRLAIVDGRLEM